MSEQIGIADEIAGRFMRLANDAESAHLARFFKTGPGEYGEGDLFLGIHVPVTRAIVKEYMKSRRDEIGIDTVRALTANPHHEIRLAGFLFLIEIYNRATDKRAVAEEYLSLIEHGNNWDLVDLIAPKILGKYLLDRPAERHILYTLAARDGDLWHQRVAMVSCWTLICGGDYADTLRLAEHFIPHPHPLMHKASGWMLREMGKRGGLPELLGFLEVHAAEMPRTMLRYSLEKLPAEQREYYMQMKSRKS